MATGTELVCKRVKRRRNEWGGKVRACYFPLMALAIDRLREINTVSRSAINFLHRPRCGHVRDLHAAFLISRRLFSELRTCGITSWRAYARNVLSCVAIASGWGDGKCRVLSSSRRLAITRHCVAGIVSIPSLTGAAARRNIRTVLERLQCEGPTPCVSARVCN